MADPVGEPRGSGMRPTLVLAISILVVIVTLGPSVTGAGPAGHAVQQGPRPETSTRPFLLRSSVPIPLTTRSAVAHFFPGTREILGVASDRSITAVAIYGADENQEVALYDVENNSSWVVQSNVPGNLSIVFLNLVSAGGEFYGVWENLTTSAEIWERITLSGKVTTPKMPVRATLPWTFAYGNSTTLYVAENNTLLELNATTLKLVENFTGHIPATATIITVLPRGDRLYLGGYRSLPNGAVYPYFGYLNITSKKVTSLTKTLKSAPSTLFSVYYALAARGNDVYVGGDEEYYAFNGTSDAFHTVQGFFYRFSPSTSSFENLSSLLPLQSWGVWSLVPWSSTFALGVAGFGFNSTTSASYSGDGVYTLSSNGSSLTNETGLIPHDFEGGGYDDSSSSSGWYFLGGGNTATYEPEVVALPT